jgi:hypothetical protein
MVKLGKLIRENIEVAQTRRSAAKKAIAHQFECGKHELSRINQIAACWSQTFSGA